MIIGPVDVRRSRAIIQRLEFSSLKLLLTGASGFFAPGLADQAMIETLCREVNLPVNIIALPHVPDKATLASLGVARISYGPVPYRQMMASLDAAAKAAFS